jgi:CDP-diacylglycerol--glycerol-3-phosphate 3-phosphatidyltransferase
MTIKHAASLITAGRMAGAFVLLLIKPLSAPFFGVYFLCCASDILDGFIARKTNTTSKFGETLDSVADFILTAVILVIFIPLLEWEAWMLYWISIIALIRFISLGIGFAKYHTFAFLHTYANKATGIAGTCFPILYQVFGLTITVVLLCVIASFSALEELTISCKSKKLDRNTKGFFFKM